MFGAVLLATASAQTYGGGGLGKTTYSVSDSFGCAQWLLALLPTEPDLPNGAVPCGSVGRVRVATSPPPTGTCTLFSGQIGLGAATDVNVPLASCVPSSGPKPSTARWCCAPTRDVRFGRGGTVSFKSFV